MRGKCGERERERERRVVYGSERNRLEMGMEIAAIQVQNFPNSILLGILG